MFTKLPSGEINIDRSLTEPAASNAAYQILKYDKTNTYFMETTWQEVRLLRVNVQWYYVHLCNETGRALSDEEALDIVLHSKSMVLRGFTHYLQKFNDQIRVFDNLPDKVLRRYWRCHRMYEWKGAISVLPPRFLVTLIAEITCPNAQEWEIREYGSEAAQLLQKRIQEG